MTREDAKQLLPIIQAFAEGKCVETKTGSGWVNMENMSFAGKPKAYRIKPESKYRPFANAEECWKEMQKHQPFGWLKSRFAFVHIIYIENRFVGYGSICGTTLHDNFDSVLEGFTFADGTPFGIKEEE